MNPLAAAWLVETLAASTVLMIVVLVLRHPVARLFGARVSYLLWVLPAARMILPPLPQAHMAIAPMGLDIQAIDQVAVSMILNEAPVAPSAAVVVPAIDWLLAGLAVWAIGCVLHFGWRLAAYRRFLKQTAGASQPLYRVSGIAVYGADVSGPAAAGILRRRILLPLDFTERFDRDEQRLALAHELAHHRRGDLIVNWIALAALSLHWFNPVAHIAYRAFRADQELACDTTVMGASSGDQLHAYASAIIKATWDRDLVAACPLNQTGQLKRRLRMMASMKKSLLRTSVGSGLVIATAAIGLGLTASGSIAAPPGPIPSASLNNSSRTQVASLTPPRGASARQGVLAGLVESRASVREQEMQPLPSPADLETGQPDLRDLRPSTLSYTLLDISPTTPASSEVALPSHVMVQAIALDAREGLWHAPPEALFRNVRATMVPGQYNADQPGEPFIGFCGEINVLNAHLRGWGRSGWKPFYVSSTRSTGRNTTPYLNIADLEGQAKCAGALSSEDYTSAFIGAGQSPSRAHLDSPRSAPQLYTP